jgi:hypothetical protein
LENVSEAVLRLGPLLLVKVTINGKSQIVAETLSSAIRRILDENPELLNSPRKLFEVLQHLRDSEVREKKKNLTKQRPQLRD